MKSTPLLRLGIFLLPVLTVMLPASPEELDAEKQTEALRDIANPHHSELTAEDFAAKYGELGNDFLLKLLEELDQATPLSERAKLCFYLGIAKEERAASKIIDIFESPMLENMSSKDLLAANTLIYSLGFLGTPESLGFLKRLATEKYWIKRAESQTISAPGVNWTFAELIREFRRQAIFAVSYGANDAARQTINEIQVSNPDMPAELFESARVACEKRKHGLHLVERETSVP